MSFDDKQLIGTWRNDLGSRMKIIAAYEVSSVPEEPDEENPLLVTQGEFRGSYLTGVGHAVKEHHITGGSWQFREMVSKPCLLVMFTVQWTKLVSPDKPPSCTCWNAQGLFEVDGSLTRLDSTYTLRRYTAAFRGWDQPVVNKDMFLKIEDE